MLPIRPSRRGLTIVEVSVAGAILLMLFAAISMIYQSGARVWRKVDLRTSLLREAQVAARNLERDLEVSHAFGIARAENAFAYLSARKDNDDIDMDSRGELLWQRFIIVFVDEEGRLRERSMQLSTPSRRAPTFQEETGLRLSDYMSGSVPTDRHLTHSGRITQLSLENAGHYGSLFELVIEGRQMVNSTETETLAMRTKVSVRN